MKSRVFRTLLSGILFFAASCKSAQVGPAIETTMAYGGGEGSTPSRYSIDWKDLDREKSARILIGRSGATPLRLWALEELPEDPRDLREAHRLAGIAQWTIVRELGIADRLGLTVIVCPAAPGSPCLVRAALLPERGVAYGVPSVGGRITPEHASQFLFGLTKSYVVTYLTEPTLGGCSVTHRDPRCLWIAEGLGGIAATKALASALRDKQAGLELAPIGYVDVLLAELSKGRTAVALVDSSGTSGVQGSGVERVLRQAAAEYLCFRWFAGAQQKLERPLTALIEHLRGLPHGPAYEDLTEWMRRTSGVPVFSEAESVPLEALLDYHKSNWLRLGWKKDEQP